MLGWVGLYSDDFSMCKRPDSKRPQALKSRVAAREAERKPHSGRVATREAVWVQAQPAKKDSMYSICFCTDCAPVPPAEMRFSTQASRLISG